MIDKAVAPLTSAQIAVARPFVAKLMTAMPFNSACAFAGNAGQESSFEPTITGDGGWSAYLLQWGGSRRSAIETWCQKNGLNVADPASQAAFVIYECPTYSPALWSYLTDTSNGGQPTRSIATLTADIMTMYEKPAAATAGLDNRIAWAQECATALASLNVPVVVSPPTPPSPSPPSPSPPPVDIMGITLGQIIISILGVLLQQLQQIPAPTPTPAPAPVPTPAPAPVPTPMPPPTTINWGQIIADILQALTGTTAAASTNPALANVKWGQLAGDVLKAVARAVPPQ